MRVRSTAITVSVRLPWRAGSARKDGRSMIVSSGTKLSSSAGSGRISRLRMNSECQANSVTTRVGSCMVGVGAADQVLHEQVLARRMGEEVGEQRVELRRRHRLVVVPPDVRLGVCVADDELVLGRAAGVLAGIGDAARHGRSARPRRGGSPPRKARRSESCSAPLPTVAQADRSDPALPGLRTAEFLHRTSLLC